MVNLKVLGMVILALSLCGAVLPAEGLGTASSSIAGISSVHGTLPVSGSAHVWATTNVKSLPSVNEGNSQSNSPLPRMSMGNGQSPPQSSLPGSTSVLTLTNTPLGMSGGFNGLNNTCGCTPPDPIIAAGPNHIVEMVNLQMEIYSKQDSSIRTISLASFFKAFFFISDPKILYDGSSGRWFASVLQLDTLSPSLNNATIAVSTTSDPTGTWNIYGVLDNGDFPDQPIIGVSDDKFAISVNEFNSAGTVYVGAHYWILNKSQMIAGSRTVDFDSYGPFSNMASIHPAQALSPTTTLYMVGMGLDASQNIANPAAVFSVTGLPHSTSIQQTSLTLSGFQNPPNATQLGTTVLINTDDGRPLDAAWSNGKLWFTMTTGCTPSGNTLRSCIRVTQFDTSSKTLLQDFNFGAKGLYYYYPALRIDALGNMGLIFGYSGQTNSTCCYPSLGVTGQGVGDPLNSLAQPQTLKKGTSDNLSQRYGDYFGASVDPSDPTLIWLAGEYGGVWSTFIGSISMVGFTVSASPSIYSFQQGPTVTSKVTVNSLGNFAGEVDLYTSVSPAGPVLSLDTSALFLNPSGQATSTLTITVPTGGRYTVTVTATNGTLTRFATLTLNVVDFSLNASPTAYSFSAGSSRSSTVSLSSLNGFSGTVHLATAVSSAPGLTASVSPVNVTLTYTASSTLTISTTASTPGGLWSVAVTGTNGPTSHTVYVTVAVTPFSFSFQNTTTFTGITVSTSGTFSLDYPETNALTFSGTAAVRATNATSGQLLASKTYLVSKFPLTSNTFILNVPTLIPLGSKVAFSLAGTSSVFSVNVKRNWDINLDGLVDNPDLQILAASFGCNIGSPCYNPSADLNADGTINVSDLAMVGSSFGLVDFVPNYNITSSTLTTPVGSTGSATVTLGSINGFSGTVNLSMSVPKSLTASLSSRSVALSVNGSSTVSLTARSTKVGTYLVNITATSGVLSHTTTVTVNIADFSISAFPSEPTVHVGVTTNITITLTSLSGFAGTVNLSLSPPQPGLIQSLDKTSIVVAAGGTATATLSLTPTTTGTWPYINVTATSGSLTHVVTVSASTFFCSICRTPTQEPTTIQQSTMGPEGSTLLPVLEKHPVWIQAAPVQVDPEHR